MHRTSVFIAAHEHVASVGAISRAKNLIAVAICRDATELRDACVNESARSKRYRYKVIGRERLKHRRTGASRRDLFLPPSIGILSRLGPRGRCVLI